MGIMDCKRYLRGQVAANVYMALLINTTATLLAGGVSLPEWVRGCCTAFTINTVASVILPVEDFSRWFREQVCKNEAKAIWKLLAQAVATNLVYVTIISACMAVLNTGVNETTIPTWWSTYPILLLVGIIGSILWEKLMGCEIKLRKGF